MGIYYIGVHIWTRDVAAVRQEVILKFAAEGFALAEDIPASVSTKDDHVPAADDLYGVMVSGRSGAGWVTAYVDDWPDSGILARHLSHALQVPALEIWVSNTPDWGYTYYEQGIVADRFASDLRQLDSPEEAAGYQGNAEKLAPLLRSPAEELQKTLTEAHQQHEDFGGKSLTALSGAVGLPLMHVYTGYSDFLEDDPEDYSPGLENWQEFRHLAFASPTGRTNLAED